MIVAADAAQLEWRTAAQLSDDKTAITEILEKQDAHALNQVTFELPSRLIAKIYLFRQIFRGSGYAYANDPSFMHVSDSPAFWDGVGEKFWKKYHGLDAQHKVWADMVMQGEPIVGPLGRSWTIELGRDRRGNIKIPWTTLSNYPVQGTGADVMCIARVSMNRRLKAKNIPAIPLVTVHDDIKYDVPEPYVQEVINTFHQTFDDLIPNIKKLFGYDWVVPLACETKCGLSFRDLKPRDRDDQ